jgi:hypothetical protein
MKPEEFELIERVGPEALARHPVWKTWRSSDRPRVLAWGVDPAALDAALERFGYCGPEPLFPVLECDPLPDDAELVVAARMRLASGHELPGYRMAPLAFGVFTPHEYAFNRGLPRFALQMAERLGAELGIARDEVFPMRWRAPVRAPDGSPLEGEIPAPW